MAQQTKTTLKSYFETGDKPTQQQFADLIDSLSGTLKDSNGVMSTTDASGFVSIFIKNSRTTAGLYFWAGTQAQYDAITTKDPQCIYFITA